MKPLAPVTVDISENGNYTPIRYTTINNSMGRLTMGCLGICDSNTKNPTNPINPRISGLSTLADDHGYTAPPQVSAITHDVVLAITRTLPL